MNPHSSVAHVSAVSLKVVRIQVVAEVMTVLIMHNLSSTPTLFFFFVVVYFCLFVLLFVTHIFIKLSLSVS